MKIKAIFSFANLFSYLRISAGMLFGYFVIFPQTQPSYVWLLAIMFLGWATDYFDGKAARQGWLGSEETQFGAKLDPIADKVFLFSNLLLIFGLLPSLLVGLVIIIIVLAEGLINPLFQQKIMLANQGKIIIAWKSKLITFVQAILLAIIFILIFANVQLLPLIILIAVATLSIIRIIVYLNIFLKLKNRK